MTSTDANWQFAIDNNDAGGDDWYLGSSATAWSAGAGKFVVSPTANSSNPAMVIDSNRDIGVGTTDPQTKLHVNGGSDVTPASGGYLTVGNVASSNIAIDNNEIMGRSNGAAGILALNAEGGMVTVNSGGTRDNDSMRIVGQVEFQSGDNSSIIMGRTNSSPTNAVLYPSLAEEGLLGYSARPFWRVYSREFLCAVTH